MSTRSFIILDSGAGAVPRFRSIYCHFDGYFDGVGAILAQHYTARAKIEQLIDLGSLSVLGPEIGDPHEFAAALEVYDAHGWTTAYHRDRGEPWGVCRPNYDDTLRPVLVRAYSSGAEYCYMWDSARAAWLALDLVTGDVMAGVAEGGPLPEWHNLAGLLERMGAQ